MFAWFLIFLMPIIGYAETNVFELEVQVKDSKEVFETFVRKTPYEACWDEKVKISYRKTPSIGSALVGGLLGRQFGKGKGKDAAIVAGTLIGSGIKDDNAVLAGAIGGALARKVGKGKGRHLAIATGTLLGASLGSRRRDSGTYRVERRCTTKYKEVRYQELVGYQNIGTLLGQDVSKFSADRLKTFRVQLNAHW